MRIVLCIRNFVRALEILRDALPSDEVIECAPDEVTDIAQQADVLVPTVAPVPAAAFQGTRLRLVQQFGVGLDSIDIEAASQAGVPVANVPSLGTGNAESVAEFVIAHMLMLCRRIPLAFQRFQERRVGAPLGESIWGSTVVILGYGGVGEETARRLTGFGVRVIAVSRDGPNGTRTRDQSIPLTHHVDASKLLDVVPEADFLIVAAPATQENIGLVGREVLERLKPGAFLINVARGPVVDYTALREALGSGRLAGAGLDVFWNEPFDPKDPLFNENVIATPHVGGVTERSLAGIGAEVAANVERVRRGEMPSCCANPEFATRHG